LAGGYRTEDALCTTHRVLLESLAELERDLHRHIHEENNVLFPRLRERLGEMQAPVGA
jgi:regulator of cell morphogenesis and NO signaling